MHIAFFLQDTGTIYGAERATLDLTQHLQQSGVAQVSVYLMDEARLALADHVLARAFAEHAIRVQHFPVRRAFAPGLAIALRRALKADDVDVLHTIGYKADLHGWLATRGARSVRLVSTVHGWLFRADPKERLYAWINLWVLRRFQRVIVLSRYYEAYLRSKGVPPKTLSRIPSGYRPCVVSRAHQTNHALTVGMLGRLSEEKNHAMLFRVVERFRPDDSIRFILAGTGPEESRIRSTIKSKGLEPLVECRGYVPTSDFFAEVDLLVLCSRIENLPYSVLEAMATGVPVVATRVGGLPDLIEDGQTGRLVDLDDDAEMATLLRACMSNPEQMRAWSDSARKKLEQEFDPQRVATAHLALYEGLSDQEREARTCG